MPFHGKFILDERGDPVPCDDVLAWARWFESAETAGSRLLRRDGVGDIVVSTVFLALNHNWSGVGDPVLWETMVFGGPLDQSQERYSSKQEAIAGHARWLRSSVVGQWHVSPREPFEPHEVELTVNGWRVTGADEWYATERRARMRAAILNARRGEMGKGGKREGAGRPRGSDAGLRDQAVMIRLTADESAALDEKRGGESRGAAIRAVVLRWLGL